MKRLLPQLKRFSKQLLVLCLVFVILTGVAMKFWTKEASAAWFDDNWAYRKAITFTHNANVSDTQVEFNIDTTDAPDKFQADCGDVRFTDANGQVLKYYYDSGAGACDTSSTDFDVLIPSIVSGSNLIYMYYGNPSVVNGTEAADFTVTTTTPSGGEGSAASEEKAPGPVAYWKFDEGTGSTAQDTTNNKENVTVASPIWKPESECVSGKCLYFDGSDDSGATQTTVDFSNTNVITAQFWLKKSSFTNSDSILLELTDNTNNYQTGFVINPDSGAPLSGLFQVNMVGNGGGNNCSGFTRPSANVWHHYTIVMDKGQSANNEIVVYVDGVLQTLTHCVAGKVENTNNFANDELYLGARNGSSLYSAGFLDEVKLYPYSRSASQVKADYNSATTEGGNVLGSASQKFLSEGLVGYWKMDQGSWNGTSNEVVDSSGNDNHGTSANGATIGAGKFGNGGSFDGNNDSVDGAMDDINGVKRWSISAWFRTSDTQGYIFDTRNSPNGADDGAALYTDGADTLKIWTTNDSANLIKDYTYSVTSTDNNWHHAVFTRDGDNSFKLYVDGVLLSPSAITTDGDFTAHTDIWHQIHFGNRFVSNIYPLSGIVDEGRIYNRSLSSAEVTALYNWAAGPVGYWRFEEGSGTSAQDLSGLENTGTLTNSPTYTQGKYGKALNFAGNDAHVTRADDSDFDFIDDADMTFQAWFKHTTASAQQVMLSKYNEAGYKIIMESDGDITCALDYDSTWSPTDSATSTAATYDDNRWHHIACVKSGASTLRLYIDGVLIATDSSLTATNTLTNSDPLYIGIDADGTSNDFVGQLDEVKIYNYARTPKQVVEDMNGGHPAGGSPVGSQIGYWDFDQGADNTCPGGADVCNRGSQGTVLNGTMTNFPSSGAWTKNGKKGGGLIFDGTNDYVSVPDTTALDSNYVTVTAWVKTDNALDKQYIVSKHRDCCASQGGWGIQIVAAGYLNGEIRRASDGTNIGVTGSTLLSSGVWYHVAMVFNGTNIFLYLNGKLEATSSTIAADTIGTGGLNLVVGMLSYEAGTSNWYPFDGTIDEVKVYNMPLTADEIKIDYNQNASQVLGSLGNNSNYAAGAANQEYCVPGDSTSCAAPYAEWNFNEKQGTTANDTSGNGRNGTITGPIWGQGKSGGGLVFDGVDDYVSSSMTTTLTNFTVGAWVKPQATSGLIQEIVSKRSYFAASNTDFPFSLYADANGTTYAVLADAGGDFSADALITASGYSLNQWHHVVGTYNGTTLNLYVDGKLAASQTISITLSNNTGRAYTVGRSSFENTGQVNQTVFKGSIDQVKMFDYARNAAQIAWDYNKGAPIAHWDMDECQGASVYDKSGNGLTGTVGLSTTGTQTTTIGNGDCTTSAQSPRYNGRTGKYNSGINFDGTSDNIQVADTNLLDFTANEDFSLSTWVKRTSTSNSDIILAKYSGSSGLELNVNSSGTVRLWMNNSYILSATNGITDTNWHNVTITLQRGGNAYMYIDGKQVGSTSSPATDTSTSSVFYIGSNADLNGWFQGIIDDVRVYSYPLSSMQVKNLYNGGAVRFGPATGTP